MEVNNVIMPNKHLRFTFTLLYNEKICILNYVLSVILMQILVRPSIMDIKRNGDRTMRQCHIY